MSLSCLWKPPVFKAHSPIVLIRYFIHKTLHRSITWSQRFQFRSSESMLWGEPSEGRRRNNRTGDNVYFRYRLRCQAELQRSANSLRQGRTPSPHRDFAIRFLLPPFRYRRARDGIVRQVGFRSISIQCLRSKWKLQ